MMIGDRVQVRLKDREAPATVFLIRTLKSATGSVSLVTYDIDGYGKAEFATLPSYSDERRERSLIPSEYAYKRLEYFKWGYYAEETDDQQETVNLFFSQYEKFRQQGRGLYIHSRTKGSGKTFLACALANDVIERYGAVVKFVSASDYPDMVIKKGDEAGDMVKAVRDCGLLVLDDIGTEGSKEFATKCMYSLIDYRYTHNLPTIYTSNSPFDRSHGDDRIRSRIYGASIPVHLPEVSVREALADRYRAKFMDEIRGS